MLLDDLFAECAAALELKYQYHSIAGNEQDQAKKAAAALELMKNMCCTSMSQDFSICGSNSVEFSARIYSGNRAIYDFCNSTGTRRSQWDNMWRSNPW